MSIKSLCFPYYRETQGGVKTLYQEVGYQESDEPRAPFLCFEYECTQTQKWFGIIAVIRMLTSSP